MFERRESGLGEGRFTRSLLAIGLLAALLAVAGCGSGGDDDLPLAKEDRPAEERPDPPEEREAQPAPETGGDELAGLDGFDPAAIYEQVVPGVITVRSLFTGESAGPFGPSAASGSGFVLDDEGTIVTNAHVITNGEGADRARASQVFVEFNDRNIVEADVVGFDPFYDVGLLEVDPDEVDLKPLALGDSEELVVGEPVAAIGSPFGEIHSLSTGVVSATDRSVRSLTDFQIEGAVQTDASINPGNSGGPLLDADGRVVGINQQMKTSTGSSDGVGFAVPIDAVRRSVEQLREDGDADYAYIGVSTQPVYPQLAERLGLPVDTGALIAEVIEDGPADDAGLTGGEETIRFQGVTYNVGGDVIVAVDGEKVVLPGELGERIGELEPGEAVEIEYVRDGETRTTEVELGERPDTVLDG